MKDSEQIALSLLYSSKHDLDKAATLPCGFRDLRVLNTINDCIAGITACIMEIESYRDKEDGVF